MWGSWWFLFHNMLGHNTEWLGAGPLFPCFTVLLHICCAVQGERPSCATRRAMAQEGWWICFSPLWVFKWGILVVHTGTLAMCEWTMTKLRCATREKLRCATRGTRRDGTRGVVAGRIGALLLLSIPALPSAYPPPESRWKKSYDKADFVHREGRFPRKQCFWFKMASRTTHLNLMKDLARWLGR